MTIDDQQLLAHYEALRMWARGVTTLTAATELLIRSGFAGPGRPWLRTDPVAIDFDAIPDSIGGKSGGEQRLLRLAASLGGSSIVVLGDEVTGMDRDQVDLVLAAIAHAAGVTEPGRAVREDAEGRPEMVAVGPLYAWPGSGH